MVTFIRYDILTIICSALWDNEKGKKIVEFNGHTGGVMSVTLVDGSTFISGACDNTAKLWDFRDGACKQTFTGHEADVNNVEVVLNLLVVITPLFSFFPLVRVLEQLQTTEPAGCLTSERISRSLIMAAVNSLVVIPHHSNFNCNICLAASGVAFSKSGRLLFDAREDFNVYIWDVIRQEQVGRLFSSNSNNLI